ncbi:uncharacterized protein BDV14DRAFT_115103 [Aspergillus stella-maris]|uniref:uncharacterized protein n=1 Tax=Aspergillus stella-maris TaxID=1810926 RepID=UPI003CCD850E
MKAVSPQAFYPGGSVNLASILGRGVANAMHCTALRCGAVRCDAMRCDAPMDCCVVLSCQSKALNQGGLACCNVLCSGASEQTKHVHAIAHSSSARVQEMERVCVGVCEHLQSTYRGGTARLMLSAQSVYNLVQTLLLWTNRVKEHRPLYVRRSYLPSIDK